MRSLMIEFHRFNAGATGILRQGDPYLIAAGDCPVRQFAMPVDQDPVLDLIDALRPRRDGRPCGPEPLKEVSALVTSILNPADLKELSQTADPVQIDVVVNAAELGLLPFEAVTDGEGQPLLARKDRVVELTRRVRGEFLEQSIRWPSRPRILFAWACPFGACVEVPHEKHFAALRDALDPWAPAGGPEAGDAGAVLTVLPHASLDAITACCREALEAGRPFSHVHLLAHGAPVGKGRKQRFGLAMHSADCAEEADIVTPEQLCEALEPLRGRPVILTLSACDSANDTNTILPERSIAHQLHASGIPVVVASQLPLSVAGSAIFVRHFYGALLAAADVRSALHDARAALVAASDQTGYDWASIVGYVRLPEGYADHLVEVGLDSILASLKVIQGWSDRLVASGASGEPQASRIEALLVGRIRSLEECLPKAKQLNRKGLLEEALGLLGSAEKRLAELRYRCGRGSGQTAWIERVRQGLLRSSAWYRYAFEQNLSHHWTGVQFLSLEAVLSGKIADPGHWHAAVLAAQIDARHEREIWAFGSLAELYMLAPLAGLPDQTVNAAQALDELRSRTLAAGPDRFPIDSTLRQLRRYSDWWTAANGYFPGAADLSSEAGRLAAELQ